MKSTLAAYFLWLPGLIGLCGIHRFYAGRWLSGVIWLLTFGLLGIGQLIDLLLIPGMIERANLKTAAYAGLRNSNKNVNNIVVNVTGPANATASPQATPVGGGVH